MKVTAKLVLTAIVAVSLVSQSRADSLVGDWQLNEGSDGIAHDSSGNSLDGTLTNGIQWIPGGVRLDGLDDCIVIPGTSGEYFDFRQGGFTLMARVRFDDEPEDGFIVGKHIGGTVEGYFLNVTNNRFAFYVNNPASNPRILSNDPCGGRIWHTVVGMYDGTRQYLYVDGVLQNDQKDIAYTSYSATDITIGHPGGGSFQGDIDWVKIYDSPVPEPLTLFSMSLGFGALTALRKRPRSS